MLITNDMIYTMFPAAFFAFIVKVVTKNKTMVDTYQLRYESIKVYCCLNTCINLLFFALNANYVLYHI